MKRLFISSVFVVFLSLQASAQKGVYSVSFNDVAFSVALDSISKTTGYFFSYNSNLVNDGNKYTLTVKDTSFDNIMRRLLVGTGLDYKVYDDQVVLNRISNPMQSQVVTISGKVVDAESKEPIPGANIFFDQTSRGTSTDISGNFSLKERKVEGQVLIISFVGYKKKSISLDKYNQSYINLEIELESELYELETITIFADSSTRGTVQQVVYDKFQRALLGISPFASACEIVNPEVLTIYYDKSLSYFEAKNSEPLRIVNNALGYEIVYDIDFFEIIEPNTRAHANIDFRELIPEDGKQRREWKRNRREAYNGSQRHFMKSLIYNDYHQDGYRMYAVDSSKLDTDHPFKRLFQNDILSFTNVPYIFALEYDGYIYVSYRKEISRQAVENAILGDDFAKNETLLRKFYKSPELKREAQKSVLKVIDGKIFIDINGHPRQPSGIATFGYWNALGLAELVPIDYKD